jgi:lipid II:glycine glycyltransferase (peptidoglycan interpeptide bridge formation enzyme)
MCLSRRSHQEDTYYHEYVRLYLANIALTAQVKELVEEKNQLVARLSKYEVDVTSNTG